MTPGQSSLDDLYGADVLGLHDPGKVGDDGMDMSVIENEPFDVNPVLGGRTIKQVFQVSVSG